MMLDATGLILAGGRASRLGGDKVHLRFGDRPLIQWAVDLLASLCEEVLICGDRSGLSGFGAPVIPDRAPGRGPAEGLVNGIRAAHHEWCVVAPCDAPFLRAPLYLDLWERRSAGPAAQNAGAVVPVHRDGRMEPVCALYSKAWGEKLSRAVARGHRRLSTMVAAAGFVPLMVMTLSSTLTATSSSATPGSSAEMMYASSVSATSRGR